MDELKIDWPSVLGESLCGLPAVELAPLEAAIFDYAPRAVRLSDLDASDALPFETRVLPWFAPGRVLTDGQVRPGAFLHHAAGDYYIQDAGSMLALELSGVQAGQSVCDTCASPGGKSTGLLELLGGDGVLVANEVIQSRLEVLKQSLSRIGFANYLVMNFEVERLAALCGAQFDCVMVDAPCSGQSMVARGKQSMSAFTTAQIEHSTARQKRIVLAAANLVRPGGRFVYSTCTFATAENEEVIEWFLQEHPSWRLLEFEHLSAWQGSGPPGCYRMWPHRDSAAGAFAAAIERVSDDDSNHDDGGPKKSRRWEWLEQLPGGLFADTQRFSGAKIASSRGELHAFPARADQAWLEQCVSGLPVGIAKSNRFEPSYGAARFLGRERQRGRALNSSVIELGDDQACCFVAGESLRVDTDVVGWCLVGWRGRILSWGKLANRVLKNHFPKTFRQPAKV